MFDSPLPPPYPAQAPLERKVYASAVVSWVVVSLICLLLVGVSLRRGQAEVGDTTPTTGPSTLPTSAPSTSPSAIAPAAKLKTLDFQTQVAAQYAIGLKTLIPGQSKDAAKQMAEQVGSSTEGRIAVAVVRGELEGREAAIDALQKISGPDARAFLAIYEPAASATTLPATTEPTAAPTTTSATAPVALGESIQARYGWVARAAESFGQPDDSPSRAAVLAEAQRTVTIMFIGFGGLAVVGIAGLVLLIVGITLYSQGRLIVQTTRPAGASHVYIESFAIYLGGFILVSILLQLIGGTNLLGHVLAQGVFVVLAAVWPLVRGVEWAKQKADWGIHTGRGVLTEALCGVGGYLAGLPIVAVGLGITLLLSQLAKVTVSHPIAAESQTPAWQLFFIASVFAPLTEELLFRGALVSHLRGAMGIVSAAVLSGVIFAAVHPQGWAAIPALASIGASLALIRQWRGSLVPSIVAHALNNGVLIGIMVLLR